VRREQSERYSQYFTDPAFRQATPGLESLRRRKDGGEYPVEVSRSPIQTARGVLVCSAARDITQRKRAEMALQHSEASYRSLTQGATCGIFRCRVDGKFLTVNPALVAMLGYGSASEG
jgi:PAS domain-containing protein